jgi:hypothetical protein
MHFSINAWQVMGPFKYVTHRRAMSKTQVWPTGVNEEYSLLGYDAV